MSFIHFIIRLVILGQVLMSSIHYYTYFYNKNISIKNSDDEKIGKIYNQNYTPCFDK